MNMVNNGGFKSPDGAANTASSVVEIGLNAAVVAIADDQPMIMTVAADQMEGKSLDALPFGPYSPVDFPTIETSLRSWVKGQTGMDLGYVEQLYTFGDRARYMQSGRSAAHAISIGYLALTRTDDDDEASGAAWRNWYDYFPWEDWREGKPAILTDEIEPRLRHWANYQVGASDAAERSTRPERLRMHFGLEGAGWDEERVLERYELLYEAGLVSEAAADHRGEAEQWDVLPPFGRAMCHDHRRILAMAMGRVRAKIKYRPVVFELMPPQFTLFELQKTVEAILGSHLHKQNFRRLVEHAGLVEPSGEVRTHTGGRPAKLFQFRRDVLLERPAPGVRVKAAIS